MRELKKWQRADNYIGEDLSEYYIVLSQHYNSEYIEQSNFAVALKRLGGENPPNVIVGHFSHWMVKWIEVILVHESDKDKLGIATDIINDFDNYPILDEDHYEELRSESRDKWIEEIRRDVENDLEDGKTVCRMWDIDLTMSEEEIEEKIYEEADECSR